MRVDIAPKRVVNGPCFVSHHRLTRRAAANRDTFVFSAGARLTEKIVSGQQGLVRRSRLSLFAEKESSEIKTRATSSLSNSPEYERCSEDEFKGCLIPRKARGSDSRSPVGGALSGALSARIVTIVTLNPQPKSALRSWPLRKPSPPN
jgi:hypothetical protein